MTSTARGVAVLAAMMLAGAMLAGCTVQKNLVPVGGSRSDGTVILAYEVGLYEKAQLDHAAGAQDLRGLGLFRRRAVWRRDGSLHFEKRLRPVHGVARQHPLPVHGSACHALIVMSGGQ